MSRLGLSPVLKLATLVSLGLVFYTAASSAWSSTPLLEVPASGTNTVAAGSTVDFAQISRTSANIAISVEAAHVKIRHVPERTEIAVLSNCPAHWNVKASIVRQVALSTTQKGVQLRADAAGAHAIVNGRVYQLPREADGAIRSLKMENGQVIINGRVLEPLPGSDKPGSCTGPDMLEVQVPEQYTGGLTIYCRGRSSINVDRWRGGSLLASLSGEATLQTGKVLDLDKAVVDVQGTGAAHIDGLWAKAFVANINGAGSVRVDGGLAELSNATVSGTGTIKLRGQFRNLKKSVQGTGTVDVSE